MAEDAGGPKDRVRIETTPGEALAFIERLASDGDFRQQLEQDPEGVLRKHGIHVSPEALQGPITLPPEDELRKLAAWAKQASEFRIMTVISPIAIFGFGPYCVTAEPRREGDPARR